MISYKFKFFLISSKINKEGLAPIMLFISLEGKRIKKPVEGIKVAPKSWDKRQQRIIESTKDKLNDLSDIYNSKLIEIENILIQYKKEISVGISSFSEISLEKRLNGKVHRIKMDFYDKYEEFLQDKKMSNKAENTIKGFRTTLNKLKVFESETGYRIAFESINIDFEKTFKSYILTTKKHGENYYAKLIATLKTFMAWAFNNGYTINLEFRKFEAKEKETTIIALDKDELLKLLHFNFSNARLSKIRDVFCFACFTGLRFSDILSLKKEHIQGTYIVKTIVKTKEDARIPLSEPAIKIIEKYEHLMFGPLPKISSQKYNKYLKECCKEAEINKPTMKTDYSEGITKTTCYPKYDLITSHVARKTFTTLSLVLGMSETAVKQITGHKKDSNFRRYVKFTDEHRKNEMDTAWSKIKKA